MGRTTLVSWEWERAWREWEGIKYISPFSTHSKPMSLHSTYNLLKEENPALEKSDPI